MKSLSILKVKVDMGKIVNYGVSLGVSFDNIKFKLEQIKKNYIICPVELKCGGQYENLYKVLNKICGLPYIKSIESFKFNKDLKSKEKLELTVQVYFYVFNSM